MLSTHNLFLTALVCRFLRKILDIFDKIRACKKRETFKNGTQSSAVFHFVQL